MNIDFDDNENLPTELCFKTVDYNYCIAMTNKGIQCRNKPKHKHYCNSHRYIGKFSKPEECPICREDLNNINKPLSCGHWVHKECVLKWKDECPICRSKIVLTKTERERLNKDKPNIEVQILINDDIVIDNNIIELVLEYALIDILNNINLVEQ